MAKTDEAKSAQEFFYRSPEANSVQLVGDFTRWQKEPINLAKQADGMWKANVPLAAGTYHYRFLVDGQWRDDPQCALRIPNIFGSYNMVREVVADAEIAAPAEAIQRKPSRRRAGRNA